MDNRNIKFSGKCPKCQKEITLDITKSITEDGEVYRCPHCGYVFRYTER